MVVEGNVEREEEQVEVPVIHLIARRLIDRCDMLDRLGDIDGAAGWNRDRPRRRGAAS